MNNKIWTVYCHTNKTNGKKYIGCTSKRPNQRYGKNGVEYIRAKQKFGQAIEKYGWDGFHHDILAQVDSEEEAEELEIAFIEKYKTTENEYGYNVAKGGSLPAQREICCYSTDGILLKKYKNVGEASNDTETNPSSIITCCRNRNKTANNFIWTYNENNIAINPDEYIPFSGERRVSQYSTKGEYIATYLSAKQAQEVTGATRSKICACCKGLRKTSGVFKWAYTDECPQKDNFNPKPSPVKKVAQYDFNNNLIRIYDSFSHASREGNIAASMVSECCNGKRENAKGYVWEFVENT